MRQRQAVIPSYQCTSDTVDKYCKNKPTIRKKPDKNNQMTTDNSTPIPAPITIQGSKIKLIPFLKEHIVLDDNERFIEPFLGSGVVSINLAPQRALLADKNPHTIALYKNIQQGKVTGESIHDFFTQHNKKLIEGSKDYFFHLRDELNKEHDSHIYLFLNRVSFRGLVRFNKAGDYMGSYRYRPYNEKNINDAARAVDAAAKVMDGKDWEFIVSDWRDTVAHAGKGDFLYIDPPYIGLDVRYFPGWNVEESEALARAAHNTPARVALSLWESNPHGKNDHLYQHWADFNWHTIEHRYQIGSSKTRMDTTIEVLAVNY